MTLSSNLNTYLLSHKKIMANVATKKRATDNDHATKPVSKSTVKKILPVDDVPMDIFALIGKSENIEQAAVAMQAMSHPMRIKILCLLSSGELIVQEIVDAVGTTQSNISQIGRASCRERV